MTRLLGAVLLGLLALPARATTIEGISQAGKSVSVNVTTAGPVAYLNVSLGTSAVVKVDLGTATVSLGTATINVSLGTAAVTVASIECPNVTISTGQVLSTPFQVLSASPTNRCGCLLSNDSDVKSFSGIMTVSPSAGVSLGVGQALRAGQSLSIDASPGVYSGSLYAISDTTATFTSLCTHR